MYCKKCGERIDENWKYCPNCKTSLQEGNIEVNEDKAIKKKSNEKTEVIIYTCLFLVGIAGLFISNNYENIFFLISLISIVTGFIRCRNSRLIKVLFWLFLLAIVLYFIAFIVLMYACSSVASSWNCFGTK